MEKRERVIGIDLGTTNSCAAVVEGLEQKVRLIPYRGGEYTIPSIYAIDDKGNELVGHEAKRQWQLNPRKTIYGSKRLIGRQYDQHLVNKMHEYFAYEIQESRESAEVVLPLGQQRFSLQDVSAKILQKIRDVASDYLGVPVRRAVVTVPAYFNDRQRQAVREAGKLIGLDVARIINEPTAAALAFGVGRGLQRETVAIYDLGGGTFDISIVEIRDRVFEVKATGGDIFLGGVDFDNCVVEWVLAQFSAKHPGVDLRQDPVAMQRIRDIAERAKIDLSNRKEVAINVPFVTLTREGLPLDVDTRLSRETYEAITQHLIDRTLETARRVVADSGLAAQQIDHVLLVGGMTRMPKVQEAVTALFGKSPSKQVNPDEAVAIGAAMYAYSLEDDSNLRVQVLDVIPMAIGIADSAGRLREIFPRNAPVPNLKSLTFTTSLDDQEDLEMRIYQGDDREAKKNALLGEFRFSGIRIAAAGKVRVEVAFQLTVDGTLELSARDSESGSEMKTTVNLGIPKGE
jgi:molecular chaperone DnaK